MIRFCAGGAGADTLGTDSAAGAGRLDEEDAAGGSIESVSAMDAVAAAVASKSRVPSEVVLGAGAVVDGPASAIMSHKHKSPFCVATHGLMTLPFSLASPLSLNPVLLLAAPLCA